MKNLFLGSVLLVVFIGGAGAQDLLAFDASILVRLGWPALKKGADKGACPLLAGSYQNSGESYVEIYDGSTPDRHRKQVSEDSFFGNPPSWESKGDQRRKEPASNGELRSKNTFWVKQINNVLQFRHHDFRDNALIEYVNWSESDKDYSCDSDLIWSRATGGGGGTESGSSDIKVQRVFGMLEDGSLLFFFRSYNKTSSFFIYKSVRRTVRYERFKPVSVEERRE